MKPIAVVGSINVDLTTYLDRWPAVGETVNARDYTISLGGKGANQCVAASRMGCSVTMVGAIGTDSFAKDIENSLNEYGVSLLLERMDETPTGMAFIDVIPSGENIIRIVRGANASLGQEHIKAFASEISSAGVVLLQNEIPLEASLEAAKIARASGAIVIMDPAPAPQPFWGIDVLSAFDIITPNAIEIKSILGSEPGTLDEALAAAKTLNEQGIQGVIVTMGDKGVAWSIEQSSGKMPAFDIDVCDTVAAGDCFNGALGSAIAENSTYEDAIVFAAKAAAISTTRFGASESAPTKEDVLSFDRSIQ